MIEMPRLNYRWLKPPSNPPTSKEIVAQIHYLDARFDVMPADAKADMNALYKLLNSISSVNEEVTTSNIDIVDKPLPKKVKGMQGLSSESSDVLSPVRRSTFAGMDVFECDGDVFERCRMGKTKYHRWDKYVGDDETGQMIREFGLKNPGKPIIVQHKGTGAMIYVRKRNGE